MSGPSTCILPALGPANNFHISQGLRLIFGWYEANPCLASKTKYKKSITCSPYQARIGTRLVFSQVILAGYGPLIPVHWPNSISCAGYQTNTAIYLPCKEPLQFSECIFLSLLNCEIPLTSQHDLMILGPYNFVNVMFFKTFFNLIVFSLCFFMRDPSNILGSLALGLPASW